VQQPINFDEVYEQNVDFVWRSARKLGVDEDAVDDITQQVFMVVHRRLAEFAHASTARSWVYGILLRVVYDYRRSIRRKCLHRRGACADPETLVDDRQRAPDESIARAQAARLLQSWLDELDHDKREVFVLAELDGLTAQEIGDALGTKMSTVYTRLRSARIELEKIAERYRSHQAWRLRRSA
jgi:RNA polymerase sigma-70 factor (ECF subfamily)